MEGHEVGLLDDRVEVRQGHAPLRELLPEAWDKLNGRRWRRLVRAAASERRGKLDPRVAEALA